MCTRNFLLFTSYLWIIFVNVNCINESTILFDIYVNTRGEHWKNQWDISTIYTNPCLLFGVNCTNNNNVTELNLGYNNLNGTLPLSLYNLTHLLSLNMSFNYLYNIIPNEIFNMNAIQIIDFSHNQFSGSLIITSNNRNNLTIINLNHNNLIGSIPSDLNNEIFPNLIQLSLNNNQFSGSIPYSLFNLNNLETLNLQYNSLTSSIPLSFNQSLLKYAYFNNNNLKHTIPRLPNTIHGVTFHSNDFSFSNNNNNYMLKDFLTDLNTKPNLYAITLYNNINLQGELPIFNSTTLKIFLAHSCQISKSLPSNSHGHFLPTHISLINNRLSSTIPSTFIHPYNDYQLDISLFSQGNKFDFNINFFAHEFQPSLPSWIDNSILNISSGQLFYTNQLKILEYVIIICVFLIVIFLIFYNLHRIRKEKIKKKDPAAYMELKKNDPLYSIIHQTPTSFFSQLKDIAKYLYFIPILLCAIITSIIYFISSDQYYTNADFLLKWSIIYIGSATPAGYNNKLLKQNILQWITSIYTTLYCAFALYLYYIFYYKFTFPILFYQKVEIRKSKIKISPNRRKSSQLMVQSNSDNDKDNNERDLFEQEEYIYTLSGKKKKKKTLVGNVITRPRSVDEYYNFDTNQQTKLLDDKSQIFIPSNPNKNSYKLYNNTRRYNSIEDEESIGSISLNLVYSPSDKNSISLSDNSSDEMDGNELKQDENRMGYTQQTQNGLSVANEYNMYSDEYYATQNNTQVDQVSNLSNSMKKQSYNTDAQQYNNYPCPWFYRNKRKLKRSFKTIFWSIIFIICECLIIFYFGTVSIPNNNSFDIDFNHWLYLILRYSVWIIIAGCNSFIIPRISKKLVKKIFWICAEWNRQEKLRKITITSGVLRSLNLVYIPMVLLFIFHNDCGRYNNKYWNKCQNNMYNNQFEFMIGNENISIKNSICSYGFFNTNYTIDYGKCFRSILEEWGTIIIFSSFGYIVCMGGFWLYSVYRYHRKLKRQYELGIRKIGSIINVEYAEIWNHIQIVVLFGCALPFVIPIIAFVLLINKWVYSSLLAMNFRLSDVNPYFPARLLIITNLLQQIIIMTFMWFNDIEGRYFVIIADLVVDLAFLIWWVWYRNTVVINKEIMSAKHQKP